MEKKLIALVFVALLGGLGGGYGLGYIQFLELSSDIQELKSDVQILKPTSTKNWHVVVSFKGDSSLTTRWFELSVTIWKISYNVSTSHLDATFSFQLMNRNNQSVVSISGVSPFVVRDVVYVLGEKAGFYYFDIKSQLIAKWGITIEIYY